MSGLTRKKITVKRKGKTFQRSVMVRASDPISAPKRYMSPSRFISKHKNQFVGMFAHGAAQGAATYAGARAGAGLFGFGDKRAQPHPDRTKAQILGGSISGYAAYRASDRIGTAIWKKAMGKRYDDINQDFSRLAPHTEQAMTRLFHGAGHVGTVVGAVTAWGAHTVARRIRR